MAKIMKPFMTIYKPDIDEIVGDLRAVGFTITDGVIKRSGVRQGNFYLETNPHFCDIHLYVVPDTELDRFMKKYKQ
jgi:hypothetical protein